MPKSINQMTRKELQSLLRRIYKADCARTQLDLTLLNTLGNFLIPTDGDGKPIRAPGRVDMPEKLLMELLDEWTDGYNKKCVPAVVALEKAILGSKY